jgi:hypothetical protein
VGYLNCGSRASNLQTRSTLRAEDMDSEKHTVVCSISYFIRRLSVFEIHVGRLSNSSNLLSRP